MPKLVLITKELKEVGKTYHGIARGPWREPRPEQSFRVVAVSTKAEYLDCVVSFGADRAYEEMICEVNGPWLYYEIQTD